MSAVRFKHDMSLHITDGRLDFYGSDGSYEWFILLEASESSPAVQLDEGLVHIFTGKGVYQIQMHSSMGFTVTLLRPSA